jgi:mannosyltransferase OCH1-like enzyme
MYSRNGHYFKLISGKAKILAIPVKIPANIFMTWKTRDLPPYMKKNVDKLKADNPEFNVKVFDDEMCREFIADHFSFSVIDAYDTLVSAYKSDLWRLCVLYIHGGIYLDIKYGCVADFKLSELLHKEHLVLDRPELWEETNKYGIYNAFMVCLPNTIFLRKAIDGLCWNVKNQIYGENAMYPTGSGLLGKVHQKMYNTYMLDMLNILNGHDNYGGIYNVVYKNRVILEMYIEYREESVSDAQTYAQCYQSRQIYKTLIVSNKFVNTTRKAYNNAPVMWQDLKLRSVTNNNNLTTIDITPCNTVETASVNMYMRNGAYYNMASVKPDVLIPHTQPQIIPKHVFMTWKTLDLPSNMQKNADKLKTDNPDFDVQIFDDAMCREFIDTHFPFPVLDAYDTLIPGAYKADLWRLCVLYIHGGIYLDIKYGCSDGIYLRDLTHKEHFVLDRPAHWVSNTHYGIYNAVMICLPGTLFLRKCIDAILINVQNKIYGYNPLYPTGPGLIGNIHAECFDSGENIDMAMIQIGYGESGADYAVVYNNTMILETYETYRSEQAQSTPVTYDVMFRSRMIYKKACSTSEIYRTNGLYDQLTTLAASSNSPSQSQPIIPNRVFITWETTKLPDKMHANLEKMVKNNPDMKFEMFSDDMCASFISKYFPELINTYRALIPGAYRADLWRYCVMYIHGGIYLDVKITPLIPLSSLLYKEHFVLDIANHHRETRDAFGIFNGILICLPGNPLMKMAIDEIVNNVKSEYYGVSALCPTGPNLFGKIYRRHFGDVYTNIDMAFMNTEKSHKLAEIAYNNTVAFSTYPEYRDDLVNHSNIHYSFCYFNRKIYTA